ncbi:hypothetical protein ANTRET_LOCUS2743 [Anthophora retusa]
MSSIEAGPRPLQVSPLIKFGRWSFLIAGILYGSLHHKRLSRRENARREQELKEKPIRDAKLAEEKRRIQEAEIKMLSETLNTVMK